MARAKLHFLAGADRDGAGAALTGGVCVTPRTGQEP